MAYIDKADFRTATLQWYTRDLTALDTTVAPDAELTAAIADWSRRLDYWTEDHFEPGYTAVALTAATAAASTATFTNGAAHGLSVGDIATVAGVTPAGYNGNWTVLTVPTTTTWTANIGTTPAAGSAFGTSTRNEVLTLDGEGTPDLWVRKRIIAVAQVATTDWSGTSRVEQASNYRVVPSVVGGVRVGKNAQDFISLIPWHWMSMGYPWWPMEAQNIQVTGQFGWTTTPDDIKRAVALMVWDHFKPKSELLRYATSWRTESADYTRAPYNPTGIPEVDAIVSDYTRTPVLVS